MSGQGVDGTSGANRESLGTNTARAREPDYSAREHGTVATAHTLKSDFPLLRPQQEEHESARTDYVLVGPHLQNSRAGIAGESA